MKKWILSFVAVVALSAIIYQVPQQTAADQPTYLGGPSPMGVVRVAADQPVYLGGPSPMGVVRVASDQPVYLGGPSPMGVIAADLT